MYPMVQTNQSRQSNQQQQEQARKGSSNGSRAVGDGGTNVQPGCAGSHQGPSLAGAGSGSSKASVKLQQKRRESRAVIVSRRQSTMQQEDVESQQQETATKHRKPSSIYRRLYNYVRQAWTGVKSALGITKSGLDNELEELEITPRYRPDSLEALRRATRFTEAELKTIYRGFKAECPTGIVREDTFKFIYSQFFPQGANTNNYAHYVFNTLDQDHSGLVSFEEFVLGLSVLSRGSLDEKLRWTFSLYDINGDGYITREEMTDIVTAIYDLMGKLVEPSVDEDAVKAKVDRIFQKMDVNRDGVVTLDEFLECCRKDEDISSSMAVFDTSI